MPDDWRVAQRRRAEAALAALIEKNPQCTVEANPPQWLVGTHMVTFGMCNGRSAVFKYYDWPARKVREEESLRLYAPLGIVPKIYAVDSDTIVTMERLSGRPLNELERDVTPEQTQSLYLQVGRALARIVRSAPGGASSGRTTPSQKDSYRFYCHAAIDVLFDAVVDRSARVLAEQEVPHADVLQPALAELRRHRDAILVCPTFVQMDDFHTNNIIAEVDALSGFIDLEMTRYGNEPLLLASVVAAKERWPWIRRGYEEERGGVIDEQLFHLARIAAPFTHWTRFMWYWTADPRHVEPGMRTSSIRAIMSCIETAAMVTTSHSV